MTGGRNAGTREDQLINRLKKLERTNAAEVRDQRRHFIQGSNKEECKGNEGIYSTTKTEHFEFLLKFLSAHTIRHSVLSHHKNTDSSTCATSRFPLASSPTPVSLLIVLLASHPSACV